MAGPENNKQYVPLTCHGHSRPVTHISFCGFVDGKDDEYYMISACKGMAYPIVGNVSNLEMSNSICQTTTLC